MPSSEREEGDVTAAGERGVAGELPFAETPGVLIEGESQPEAQVQDGGFQAWLQVAGSFALYFNHLGILNGYGVYQTFYENNLLSRSSPSAIAWIGSIQIFCLMAVAVFVGPLYDAGYCRTLLVVGTVLVTLGFMLTSISTVYWQILLAQGICIGLGMSCLSVPSIANVPMYFTKRRAFAMGMASVGSGLGASIYPLVFQKLQPAIGFGWTVRIIGFIAFAMCIFAIAVIRPRTKPGAAWTQGGFSYRWFYDSSAFRERTYIVYCFSMFFNNLCFFQPNFYMQSYALAHGMQGLSLVHYILTITNAASIPGRIITSYIADRTSSLDTYCVICAFSCASLFYWISVNNSAGNVAFSVLWGFFSGGIVSIASVILTYITPDMSRLGTRLGMVSILKGISSLIGSPISGALLTATGGYLSVQLFSSFGIMLTALGMMFLRLDLARTALKKSREAVTAPSQPGDAQQERPEEKSTRPA